MKKQVKSYFWHVTYINSHHNNMNIPNHGYLADIEKNSKLSYVRVGNIEATRKC